MRRSRGAILVVALCSLAHARGANAGVDRVVIEAYEGDRPTDADTTLEPIYGDLLARGYASGSELSREVIERVSREGGQLTASQIVDAQKKVEDAFQRFIDGDYARALDKARAALDLYASAPAQLAREPALRDLRFKALVIAARCNEVNGSATDAFSLMAEELRSFPDHPVTTADFDPSVIKLNRQVREELVRQGLGTLEVKVDDPTATIFVDERFAGAGSAKLGQLIPGRYRVFATKGDQVGRIHEIEIAPGANAFVTIDWQLDAAIRTSPGLVAIDVGRDAANDTEVQLATRLARGLGTKTVVVLSLRLINGRRAIAGYSIDVESQTRAFAAVQIEPISPSTETLKHLAALLAGDKVAGNDLITTEPIAAVSTPINGAGPERDEVRWYDDRLGWIIAGAGVVVLGGGIYAAAHASSLDDQAAVQTSQVDRQRLQDDASNYRKAGEVLLITGGVVTAAGIVRLVLVPSPSSTQVTARSSGMTLDVGVGWLGVRGSF